MAREGRTPRRVLLGVNVDHVATLRQARRASFPDPVEASRLALRGGADGITVHLREDRRHIQDSDVERLAAEPLKLNLEMAATPEMVEIACRLAPSDVCIVPEKRAELTTEGGLSVAGHEADLAPIVARLRDAGIRVSLFVDPALAQIGAASRVGAAAVELHTGRWATVSESGGGAASREESAALAAAAQFAAEEGLLVNAGHGLTIANVGEVARLPAVCELNIGHSIVARAVLFGMEAAVREMRLAIDSAVASESATATHD